MTPEIAVQRLTDEFGEPTSFTTKVCRWHLSETIDLIAQTDMATKTVIWLPTEPPMPNLPIGERYTADRSRNHHTYHDDCPSLGKGKAAIRISLGSTAELNRVVEVVKAVSGV